MKESAIDIIYHNFFKVTFALVLVALFFYIMLPFMISIILGGILAMALSPVLEFIMRRGFSRKTSLFIFSLLLAIAGFFPVIGFFVRGARILSERMKESDLNEMTAKLTASVQHLIDHISTIYDLDKNFVQNKFTAAIQHAGNFLAKIFSEFLSDLPLVLMTGLITLLSVYFFLKESDRIRALFDRYSFFTKKHGDRFVHVCKACCQEVFFANILTGLLQATIVSLGALLFHTGDFFLIFFLTFVLSFIPVIGAAPVAIVLTLISFVNGHIGSGIGLLVVAVITGVSDNIIRPYLGTLGEVEVHPFIGLLAVIGGVIMIGLPGLFIGPLIAALIFGALPIIAEEYFEA